MVGTALSRMRWLFVIARNSSFTYKGRAVDVKQVGRELGVRYVLEGSVRKAGLFSGWVKAWLGEPEVALEHVARAMRLSPHDPQFYNMQAATASAHFFVRRQADAFSWAEPSAQLHGGGNHDDWPPS
jgi:hypothetical protein